MEYRTLGRNRKRRSGEFLGGLVDFAGADRSVGFRECPKNHRLDGPGPRTDSSMRLGLRHCPGGERANQPVRRGEPVAVQECPVFFQSPADLLVIYQ